MLLSLPLPQINYKKVSKKAEGSRSCDFIPLLCCEKRVTKGIASIAFYRLQTFVWIFLFLAHWWTTESWICPVGAARRAPQGAQKGSAAAETPQVGTPCGGQSLSRRRKAWMRGRAGQDAGAPARWPWHPRSAWCWDSGRCVTDCGTAQIIKNIKNKPGLLLLEKKLDKER